ncbi:MAG: epoxyqueuosine reductase [Promethearchaeota archaeon]
MAFAKANDPLFLQLKNIITFEHKLPNELLSNAKTVISYFIPFNLSIVSSNNKGKSPSIEWAIAYVETNKLINEINLFLSNYLEKEGFNSLGIPPTNNFNKELLVSYWSHKHVAYIAGLGKFGLHKMIITEKGCCGRLGTLITSAKIKSTTRIEKESCLYFYNKTCKLCIDKCFFDVLKLDSFDRHKCYKICLENGKIYSSLGLTDICGKCACGIPCSTENPVD